ncbi:hypothetical protein ACXGQW_11295 [Wenyingzhuangia sp. IMCC45533]
MLIRSSKFYGFCYADEISEKEFFAKNFEANIEDEFLILSFTFVKGLDKALIEKNVGSYRFFEIEDTYIMNKVVKVLNEFPAIRKVQLHIKNSFVTKVKHLKITVKGLKISLD